MDGEQVLWIGTPTGVSRMRDGVVLDPTPAQQACGVFAFGLDELRRVWTTCSGGQVGILGPDTHARGALEAASDRPYGIRFGPGGDFWVLGEAGSVWRWREATRAVEAMVDLDGFKALSDRHGHPVGDRRPVEGAASLTRASRRDLDLVARYGGDDLAVLLPDSGSAGALRVAERALAEVRRLQLGPDPAGSPVTVSVSIGSATSSPREGGLPADLVDAADQALYLAKAHGRNRVAAARGAARAAAEE